MYMDFSNWFYVFKFLFILFRFSEIIELQKVNESIKSSIRLSMIPIFLFFMEQKDIIRTHNSSCITLKYKSLDIYWVVSNPFCLSHPQSIEILYPDLIGERVEKSFSLFRNLLSFFCWIIGFRHDFGDLYSFQKGSNIPFYPFFFFLWEDYRL